MIQFSNNPKVAERQMQAVIFYLTTFGYIDGDFDQSEREFVSQYIEKLVRHRVDTGMAEQDEALKAELVVKYTQHFHEEFERIDNRILELFHEPVPTDEDQHTFVQSKLKTRCFEIFQSFDKAGQESLMETVDELLMADGVAHPAEVKFRAELASLLESDLGIVLEEEREPHAVKVAEEVQLLPQSLTHPFFGQFEHHYSGERETLLKQLDADIGLIDRTSELFAKQRMLGLGKLAGKRRVEEFAGQEPFLDGHVYVVPTAPGRGYDITVLGDLHGCYSCLKAALLQADFFGKLQAHHDDPKRHPPIYLVLLGDYIDRGRFSLSGTLRTAMQLFVKIPEHVFMLRGNHEYYVELDGRVLAPVRPCEAMESIAKVAQNDVFVRYMQLFEALPSMLAVGTTLFVHGGIPRAHTLRERWRDLSSLNDPEIRFQMLWSDPSTMEVVPPDLQQEIVRFPFGRRQFQQFLARLGCRTMVRGHQRVKEGFRKVYGDPEGTLLTLFSAGGADNLDLPDDCALREITPMALSVRIRNGVSTFVPFRIDYARYNDPRYNGFFEDEREPELEELDLPPAAGPAVTPRAASRPA